MPETKALPRGVMGERRREPRTRVEVGCQAVADFDFVLLSDEIVDLSTKGALLRADGMPAEIGEEVILSFQPPGSTQWIDVEARIVRLLNGTEPGAPGYGLELSQDLPPFERGLLEAALERSKRGRRRKLQAPRHRVPPRPDAVRTSSVKPVGRPSASESGLTRRIVVVG